MPERVRLLELALKGLQADRAKLDDEIAQIKRELGERSAVAKVAGIQSATTDTTSRRKRRRMSAAARRRISVGMKRRYAAMRAAAKK
jgi:hypothetical protein